MRRRRGIAFVSSALAAAGIGALPGVAAGDSVQAGPFQRDTPPLPQPTQAGAHIYLTGVGGKVLVGRRETVHGVLRPFVPDQKVLVKLVRSGHTARHRTIRVRHGKGDKGIFRFGTRRLIKPGRYRVIALHRATAEQHRAVGRSKWFSIRYPDLDPGDRRGVVRTFNRLLARRGYITGHGRTYGRTTGYGVLAFRKTNKMARTSNATPGIFRRLADGKGRFHLKHPGAGRHVEVDISRQVEAFASHGKPQYTIPVSTGAPASPTIRGHYHFYSRQPGYNSEGMYYSVYWHGGYAIHGYASVPTYPASHGCVREPIPLAHFAYDWVRLGMSIYTYD